MFRECEGSGAMTATAQIDPYRKPDPNKVGVLTFELEVSHLPPDDAELSSPDRQLLAIRNELLPELDQTLAAAQSGGDAITIDTLDLDLGQFPLPPDWPTIRAAFRGALLSALAPYLKQSAQTLNRRSAVQPETELFVTKPTKANPPNSAKQQDQYLINALKALILHEDSSHKAGPGFDDLEVLLSALKITDLRRIGRKYDLPPFPSQLNQQFSWLSCLLAELQKSASCIQSAKTAQTDLNTAIPLLRLLRRKHLKKLAKATGLLAPPARAALPKDWAAPLRAALGTNAMPDISIDMLGAADIQRLVKKNALSDPPTAYVEEQDWFEKLANALKVDATLHAPTDDKALTELRLLLKEFARGSASPRVIELANRIGDTDNAAAARPVSQQADAWKEWALIHSTEVDQALFALNSSQVRKLVADLSADHPQQLRNTINDLQKLPNPRNALCAVAKSLLLHQPIDIANARATGQKRRDAYLPTAEAIRQLRLLVDGRGVAEHKTYQKSDHDEATKGHGTRKTSNTDLNEFSSKRPLTEIATNSPARTAPAHTPSGVVDQDALKATLTDPSTHSTADPFAKGRTSSKTAFGPESRRSTGPKISKSDTTPSEAPSSQAERQKPPTPEIKADASSTGDLEPKAKQLASFLDPGSVDASPLPMGPDQNRQKSEDSPRPSKDTQVSQHPDVPLQSVSDQDIAPTRSHAEAGGKHTVQAADSDQPADRQLNAGGAKQQKNPPSAAKAGTGGQNAQNHKPGAQLKLQDDSSNPAERSSQNDENLAPNELEKTTRRAAPPSGYGPDESSVVDGDDGAEVKGTTPPSVGQIPHSGAQQGGNEGVDQPDLYIQKKHAREQATDIPSDIKEHDAATPKPQRTPEVSHNPSTTNTDPTSHIAASASDKFGQFNSSENRASSSQIDQPAKAADRAVEIVDSLQDQEPHVRNDAEKADPAHLRTIFDRLNRSNSQDLHDALALLWSALPETAKPSGNPETAFWTAAISTAMHADGLNLKGALKVYLNNCLPDSNWSDLRNVITRLGYATGDSTALRHRLRDTLSEILADMTPDLNSINVADRHLPMPTPSDLRLLSQASGIVLFHPFLKLLFERLEITWTKKGLTPETAGKAAATLAFLATGSNDTGQPVDVLVKHLIGLPATAPSPTHETLELSDQTMIDGLVRSVIDQWGRIGKTSPDGLRAAFVQRDGVLQTDQGEFDLLTVNEGPYDMLLDGLPWSISTVALPWMPRPLSVKWRRKDD